MAATSCNVARLCTIHPPMVRDGPRSPEIHPSQVVVRHLKAGVTWALAASIKNITLHEPHARRLCDIHSTFNSNFFSFLRRYFSCEYLVFSLKVVLCSTTVPTTVCVGDKEIRDVMFNKKITTLTRIIDKEIRDVMFNKKITTLTRIIDKARRVIYV